MELRTASSFLVGAFVVFSVTLAALFVAFVGWASARSHAPDAARWKWTMLTAGGAALWMTASWLVAAAGVLAQFDRRPPPMVLLFVAVFAISVTIAFSALGNLLVRAAPLAALVAFQSFRLPLELLMHRAAEEGVMPPQMTYTGWNFDIVTGASAIVVAIALERGAPLRLAAIWNVIGALLLANILIIAMVSTPVFAAFGEDRLNTWVAYPPFIWLPTVMVVLALSGHMLVWRALTSAVSRAEPA